MRARIGAEIFKFAKKSIMKYVAALDVGTTTVRFHILDEKTVTVASSAEKVCCNLIFIFSKDCERQLRANRRFQYLI